MVRRQQASDRAARPKVRSPGTPPISREVQHRFWVEIATRLLPEEAAARVGVSQPVGGRWFHNAGGMPPFDLSKPPSGRYLSFAERAEITILNAQRYGVREIARRTGRDPGTISRELRRNAATRGSKLDYRASVAQWKSDIAAKRPKIAKLVANPRLRDYVEERLSGQIVMPDGVVVSGPQSPKFTGRNKPHRKDRPWSWAWSPEQIANRIRIDFPDDDSMRISHEAIQPSPRAGHTPGSTDPILSVTKRYQAGSTSTITTGATPQSEPRPSADSTTCLDITPRDADRVLPDRLPHRGHRRRRLARHDAVRTDREASRVERGSRGRRVDPHLRARGGSGMAGLVAAAPRGASVHVLGCAHRRRCVDRVACAGFRLQPDLSRDGPGHHLALSGARRGYALTPGSEEAAGTLSDTVRSPGRGGE